MKLLSVAIPCYNSEAYMSKCINSLLIGGEEVEIIIVDDGSSDRTAEIADDYAEKYPTIVKAIHQENGGHGQAVNTGIKNATGLYFKVVDSDDWVNQDAYYEVLKTLYELIRGAETVDLLISNFVYEKQGATRKKVMQYRHCFPTNQIFGWDEVRHMKKGQYLLMHSMIYRTKLLHDCGMELPKHTFYVDNLFAFEPLPYVKNLYYLDVNFYRYFIGKYRDCANLPNDDVQADMYLAASEILQDHGYEHYEISNFARPGFRSRHNLKYWTGGEYLGFGPCAASDFAGKRFTIEPDLRAYVEGIAHHGSVLSECETIPPRERAGEYVMLRSRIASGMDAQEYERSYLLPFAPLQQLLERFAGHGLAAQSGSRWYLTPRGWLVSNRIILALQDAQEKSTPLAKKR